MLNPKIKKQSMWLLSLILVLVFNNCSPSEFTPGLLPSLSLQEAGNGGAYEGKLVRYDHYDSKNPCIDIGANQKPLPNKEIFITSSSVGVTAQLVRNHCQDLPIPTYISDQAIHFSNDGGGELTYDHYLYLEKKNIGDFEVIASTCPAGYTPRSSISRQNLMTGSQALTRPPWVYLAGLQGTLAGSLGSLPRFQLQRNDPNSLEWYRRIQQEVLLKAGQFYSFTFFAQSGTVEEVYVSGWHQNNMALNVYFNLNTGEGRDVGSFGFTDLSYSSRTFAGGQILTVYFKAPVSELNYFGVTPAPPSGPNGIQDGPSGKVGDSISITALQLEEVHSYCTPMN